MSERLVWLVRVLVGLAAGLTFSNTLDNGFQLDDIAGLVENPWIRDLGNVPRFFVDPRTLTSLKANADYRPLLQVTYALNHAISGYQPWSWHLVNLSLHLAVALSVLTLGRTLLGTGRVVPCAGLDEAAGDRAAAAAALLFAVHPLATGPVNYLWARSSLLVAALVLPATAGYVRAAARGARPDQLVCPFLLFVLALLAKAEAVSFFGVALLSELVLARDRSRSRGRLAPFALALSAYLSLRAVLVPDWVAAARHAADVTPLDYLLTQLRVWWLYVAHLFWPFLLAPDDTSFPVSRSLAEPLVVAAALGWLGVLAGLARSAARAPALAFCGLTFFAHLAPHSSLAPLSEMYNQHRPYLPATGLVLLLAAGSSAALRAWPRGFLAGVVLLACGLSVLSHQRNAIWRDDLSLWRAAVAEAPRAARPHINLGVALLTRGHFDEAERYLRRAVRLAPTNPSAHTNLANALDARDDRVGALAACDEAVRVAPCAPLPYYCRAAFRASWGDCAGALPDLREALRHDDRHAAALELSVTCLVKLGRHPEARAVLAIGLALDPARFGRLIGPMPR